MGSSRAHFHLCRRAIIKLKEGSVLRRESHRKTPGQLPCIVPRHDGTRGRRNQTERTGKAIPTRQSLSGSKAKGTPFRARSDSGVPRLYQTMRYLRRPTVLLTKHRQRTIRTRCAKIASRKQLLKTFNETEWCLPLNSVSHLADANPTPTCSCAHARNCFFGIRLDTASSTLFWAISVGGCAISEVNASMSTSSKQHWTVELSRDAEVSKPH